MKSWRYGNDKVQTPNISDPMSPERSEAFSVVAKAIVVRFFNLKLYFSSLVQITLVLIYTHLDSQDN